MTTGYFVRGAKEWSMVMTVQRPLVVLLLVLECGHDSSMTISCFVRVAKSGHDSSMTTRCFVTGAKNVHGTTMTTALVTLCFVRGAKEWS